MADVCKFCRAPAGPDCPYPFDLTAEELREWEKTGNRPHSIGHDGMGERELLPCQSPVEAAYRRGVAQALTWAKHPAAKIAQEMRFSNEVYTDFLRVLDGRIT